MEAECNPLALATEDFNNNNIKIEKTEDDDDDATKNIKQEPGYDQADDQH